MKAFATTARESESAPVNVQTGVTGVCSAGPDVTVPDSDEDGWYGGGREKNFGDDGGANGL